MPASAIFENLEAGANIDDIMEWFDGLDREQVKAVIDIAFPYRHSIASFSISGTRIPRQLTC